MNKKVITDYSTLRCDRRQPWAFKDDGHGLFYSGYAGEPITKLPAYEFVVEHLTCGNDLKFENTSYYGFISDLGKIPHFGESAAGKAEDWCTKFAQTIEYSKKLDWTLVNVFEICDGLYMILDGHHRACCASVQGKSIIADITGSIKKIWDFTEEQKTLIDQTFENNYPHLKYYYPPFWKDANQKLIRKSDDRLNVILKDLVSLKGRTVLDVGCCTGFFSSAIDQIPAMCVTSLDLDKKLINIITLRKQLTGHPFKIIHGTVRDIKSEFHASLFIDVFFQILTNAGLNEAKYQFERICEITKQRIYFGFGLYPTLNKYGTLSNFYRRILSKYGFDDVEMIYFGRDEDDLYKRPIFVAKK